MAQQTCPPSDTTVPDSDSNNDVQVHVTSDLTILMATAMALGMLPCCFHHNLTVVLKTHISGATHSDIRQSTCMATSDTDPSHTSNITSTAITFHFTDPAPRTLFAVPPGVHCEEFVRALPVTTDNPPLLRSDNAAEVPELRPPSPTPSHISISDSELTLSDMSDSDMSATRLSTSPRGRVRWYTVTKGVEVGVIEGWYVLRISSACSDPNN
jgi:hypothetical protein